MVSGCKGHRLYHPEPADDLQRVEAATPGAPDADLAIIEFDDQGLLWEPRQLNAAIARIRERNAETPEGVLVVMFSNSWHNDADPDREEGDLPRFRAKLSRMAAHRAAADADRPTQRRVVGVYLGWRGRTAVGPLWKATSFWDRRRAALRVASNASRETIFKIMSATRENPRSKGYVAGHSMGGLIVARTLSPSLATLLLTAGPGGVKVPTDFVVLLNPAVDALSSWDLIDLFQRTGARVELRGREGGAVPSRGPLVASITSEADVVLRTALPLGLTLNHLGNAFKGAEEAERDGRPTERHLATHAEGLVDHLVSHRAWVDDAGVVRVQRVPGAWNDTPYWVIRVSEEISSGHGDTDNPRLNRLLDDLAALAGVNDAGVDAWLLRGDAESATP